MKIYFCDVCNESIPFQDIKNNKALTLKGKIYCHNCNPLKEVQQRSAGMGSSALITSLMSAVIVLLVGAIVLIIWNPLAKDEEVATAAALAETHELVIGLQKAMDNLRGDFDSREEKIKDLDFKLSKVETEIILTRGDLQGQRSQIDNMLENFKSVTNVREALDEFVLKQDEYSSSLEDVRTGSAALKTDLNDLNGRLERLASTVRRGGIRVSGGPVDRETSTTEEFPALAELKAKLASKDDGERFEAVYQVLDERIKDALPFILPLIQDSDQFVQVGAIKTVGEFLYSKARPHLSQGGRGPDVTVRDEAWRQLMRMTGKNDLNFNIRGNDSERERAVKKWEKWLKNQK